jgi:hypothetical protein
MKSKWILLALALVACAQEKTADDSAGAAANTTMPMPDMQGMEGMGGMGAGNMMNQMQAHMDSMQSMSGDQMRANLSSHRQMVANMLADMNRQMRDMNMSAGDAWNVLVDSVRSDLTAMPEMMAAELSAMRDAHYSRIRRLMDMHASMMKGM